MPEQFWQWCLPVGCQQEIHWVSRSLRASFILLFCDCLIGLGSGDGVSLLDRVPAAFQEYFTVVVVKNLHINPGHAFLGKTLDRYKMITVIHLNCRWFYWCGNWCFLQGNSWIIYNVLFLLKLAELLSRKNNSDVTQTYEYQCFILLICKATVT